MILTQTDNLLTGRGAFDVTASARPRWWILPAIIMAAGMLYGAVMGSYGFTWPDRLPQVVYSAVKVPLLVLVTSSLCLPGFFVLNTVLGLRDDLMDSLRAVLAGQAAFAVALASLAPLTRVFYFSTNAYETSILFNGLMFALAACAAQLMMQRYYRVLIARQRFHRITFYAWLVTYTFVGIQMGWTLRPFVGSPNMAVTFFRQEPLTNAYVVVARLLFG